MTREEELAVAMFDALVENEGVPTIPVGLEKELITTLSQRSALERLHQRTFYGLS